MSRKTLIKYYFWNDTLPKEIPQIPNNAFPKIKSDRVTYYTDVDRCPVVSLYHSNTFILRSPVDITFSVDKNYELSSNAVQEIKHDNHTVWVNVNKSSFFDVNFIMNYLQLVPKNNLDGFLNCQILFSLNFIFERQDLMIVVHDESFVKNTYQIPGAYNIGQWNRPLNFAFYIEPKSRVEIRRGDPLLKFTLVNPTNDVISLEPEEDGDVIDSHLRHSRYFQKGAVSFLLGHTRNIISNLDEWWSNK